MGIMILGSVMVAWTLLSILGHERQRRLDMIKVEIENQKPAPSEPRQ